MIPVRTGFPFGGQKFASLVGAGIGRSGSMSSYGAVAGNLLLAFYNYSSGPVFTTGGLISLANMSSPVAAFGFWKVLSQSDLASALSFRPGNTTDILEFHIYDGPTSVISVPYTGFIKDPGYLGIAVAAYAASSGTVPVNPQINNPTGFVRRTDVQTYSSGQGRGTNSLATFDRLNLPYVDNTSIDSNGPVSVFELVG